MSAFSSVTNCNRSPWIVSFRSEYLACHLDTKHRQFVVNLVSWHFKEPIKYRMPSIFSSISNLAVTGDGFHGLSKQEIWIGESLTEAKDIPVISRRNCFSLSVFAGNRGNLWVAKWAERPWRTSWICPMFYELAKRWRLGGSGSKVWSFGGQTSINREDPFTLRLMDEKKPYSCLVERLFTHCRIGQRSIQSNPKRQD